MQKKTILLCLLGLFLLAPPTMAPAAEAENEDRVYDAGQVQVTAKGERRQIRVDPQKTTISLDNYQSVGSPQNVGDIVKDMVIIDYRGATDLVPDDDTLYMRGFDSHRFVTALDGSTLRKTGGRRSSHIVDYAMLPPFLIEAVEILPGPHSALYPGKSIGGVVNFVTAEPHRYDSLKPDVAVALNYGTYDTRNHSASLQGGIGDFIYDLGYQKYATNGFLRHNEADIDTIFGRVGYILPNDGYITLSASYADADRERATVNDPNDPASDYDPDHPVLEKVGWIYYQWQDPTWDKIGTNYRLNLKLPSPIGTWTASAYYGEENRDHALMEWVNPSDPSQGVKDGSWDTQWHQQGGKIANEFQLAEGHLTTLGMELEQCYDGYGDVPGWGNSTFAHDDKKRIEIKSGFAQHEWAVNNRLTLEAGLRYEDTTVWVSNFSSSSGTMYITGREKWIKRNWSALSPKSFITYEFDDLARSLRDTSISLGVSRIWRAPDYHGEYNGSGRPQGAWIDPEHGVAYDLVFNRRLTGDIQMKLNYAYYKIKDYLVWNSKYSKYTPGGGNVVPPGLEYLDRLINLHEVIRQGVELQVDGHLGDKLYFLLGYAWQDFENQGNEPAGETDLGNQIDNYLTARVTYQLSPATSMTLHYEYKDDQVITTSTEIAPDIWEFEDISIDSFDVVNLSLTHTLFEKWQGLNKGTLRLYVNNLLNEDYQNTSGYPATDLTVGTGIELQF